MTMPVKENAAPAGTGNGAPISYNHTAHNTMDPAQLARLLGGEQVARDAILVPGPGHSDDDRSLSVKFVPTAPGGFITKSFAGDHWRDCRAHVEAVLGPVAFSQLPAIPQTTTFDPDAWRATWERGNRANGTIVERYLNGRGVDLPSHDVRYHPRIWLKELGHATEGMLCVYRDVHTHQTRGVHRTFLDADGKRLHKKMLGKAPEVAVTFGSGHPGVVLGITEGIETALSLVKMGWPDPVWACMSSERIRKFPLIDGVEELFIFADNDKAGITAAQECAERWTSAGRISDVRHPKQDRADWNDVLRGVAK